jgi:hypothetical protein
MKVNKSSSVQGSWVDKKLLQIGDVMKIVSEASEQPAPQGERMQLVAKVLIRGKSKEPENIAINAPTKNALIDAFGDDTSDWVGKIVTVHVELGIFSGKRGIALYLIPAGMIMKESDDGYIYIGHKDGESGKPLTSKSSKSIQGPPEPEESMEGLDPDAITF